MASHETSPPMETPQKSATIDSTATASAPVDSPTALMDSSQTAPDETYLNEIDSDGEFYDTSVTRCPGCGGYHEGSFMSPNDSEYDSYILDKPVAPPRVKPFLTSFTLFPKLPIEIRDMVWRQTLEPRTVEIDYNTNHGFYSRAKIPIALRVCPESRRAVANSYSLCFGSLLHNPGTVFNFSLDTLYFEWDMQPRITQFIVSMSKTEAESIQSMAIDYLMDEAESIGPEYASEDRAMDTFKAATQAMPALKEFLIVNNLHEDYDDHGIPCGSGPIVLFEEFPYELQKYVWSEGFHMDNPDEACSQVPPDLSHLTKGFDVPKTVNVFGWRPTVLPGVNGPTWTHPSILRNSKS